MQTSVDAVITHTQVWRTGTGSECFNLKKNHIFLKAYIRIFFKQLKTCHLNIVSNLIVGSFQIAFMKFKNVIRFFSYG